jgi:hypothetical protein
MARNPLAEMNNTLKNDLKPERMKHKYLPVCHKRFVVYFMFNLNDFKRHYTGSESQTCMRNETAAVTRQL